MAQRRPKAAILGSRICPPQTRSLFDEPATRLPPDKSPELLKQASSGTRAPILVSPPIRTPLFAGCGAACGRASARRATVDLCDGCGWLVGSIKHRKQTPNTSLAQNDRGCRSNRLTLRTGNTSGHCSLHCEIILYIDHKSSGIAGCGGKHNL